jgi:hypothetical protein
MRFVVMGLLLVTFVPSSAKADDGGCGSNSPRVGDGIFFDEMDLSGAQANKNGMRVVAVTSPVGAKLGVVDRQELTTRTPGGVPQRIAKGARILVEHVPSGAEFEIEVKNVGDVPFAFGGGTVPGYELAWKKTKAAIFPDRLPRHSCANVPPDPVGPELVPVCNAKDVVEECRKVEGGDDGRQPGGAGRNGASVPGNAPAGARQAQRPASATGGYKDPYPSEPEDVLEKEKKYCTFKHHAIAFQGDRYDNDRRVVLSSRTLPTSWVNFACVGTTMAKMHIHRHTDRGSVGLNGRRYRSSPAQRTALLKMFTADYYGRGFPFTKEGTIIRYDDVGPWFTTRVFDEPGPPGADEFARFEAIWTRRGVYCLHQPRRERREFVEKYGQKNGLSPIPECTESQMRNWRTRPGAYFATGLPRTFDIPVEPPTTAALPASTLPPRR